MTGLGNGIARAGLACIMQGSALLFAGVLVAQELEPRAYRSLPTGIDFTLAAYQFSSGNVVFDATSPVENLEIDIHNFMLGYVRTFGLAGRSSSIAMLAPWIYAHGSGELDGVVTERSRSGWADARIRLAVNLVGGPAMRPQEFRNFKQGRTLGVGLTVSLPTGQYDSENVVNFGANRWGFKPEIGYSSVRGPWIFDTAFGIWAFTNNNDGPGGSTVSQEPILSWQGHVSYQFRSRIWLALDLNYFRGGGRRIDGGEEMNFQTNSRVGMTLSIPFGQRHSLKLALAAGAYTRAGADFNVGTITHQYRWGR